MTHNIINDIDRQEIVIDYLEGLIESYEASRIADNIYLARPLKAQLEIEQRVLTMLKDRVTATEFNV